MIFEDRREAGKKLAEKLQDYTSERCIVLALPRGGVPIGLEIAKALDCPLDVLVARKLGSPRNPELGVGAIAPEGVRVLDEPLIDHLGLTEKEIALIEQKERQELERRIKKYRGKDSIPDIRDKIVILVDDGLATGVTARAAIYALLKKNPKKLVVAIPVCAFDSMHDLLDVIRSEIDSVVCLSNPYDFGSVGTWYRHFDQVTDEQVRRYLREAKHT